MKTSTFISITWRKALELVNSGELKIIGSNLHQINNQGEFTMSKDGKSLYKRRHSANKAIYDLIANK